MGLRAHHRWVMVTGNKDPEELQDNSKDRRRGHGICLPNLAGAKVVIWACRLRVCMPIGLQKGVFRHGPAEAKRAGATGHRPVY